MNALPDKTVIRPACCVNFGSFYCYLSILYTCDKMKCNPNV